MSTARSARTTTLILLAALTLVAALLAATGTATAAPEWAPADQATVHPGVQTYTQGAQCTANFVFTDGTDVFVGQAAHCASTSGSTSTNGCEAGVLPVGTQVEVEGASQPGVMVYNSWATMQANGETDTNACNYNDFALIELDPADHDVVNPSVPFFGGPNGLDTDGVPAGEQVHSYGNSSLRLGITALSPKEGTSLGTSGGGWTHTVYTATPGVPGDSGSGFIDSDGDAMGVLSTVALAPLTGSNGVSDLALALDYMRANSSYSGVTLVHGTVPFNGGTL